MKKVWLTVARAQTKLHDILTEDRGDTNFISIMIILGIVLAIAVIFIGFKDTIVTTATKKIDEFIKAFK